MRGSGFGPGSLTYTRDRRAVYGLSNWETGKHIPDSEADVRTIARRLSLDEDFVVRIWKKDRSARLSKGDHIVTRAYNTASDGGGSSEDPY